MRLVQFKRLKLAESGDDFTFLPPLDPALRPTVDTINRGEPVPVPSQEAAYNAIEMRSKERATATVTARQAPTGQQEPSRQLPNVAQLEPPTSELNGALVKYKCSCSALRTSGSNNNDNCGTHNITHRAVTGAADTSRVRQWSSHLRIG